MGGVWSNGHKPWHKLMDPLTVAYHLDRFGLGYLFTIIQVSKGAGVGGTPSFVRLSAATK